MGCGTAPHSGPCAIPTLRVFAPLGLSVAAPVRARKNKIQTYKARAARPTPIRHGPAGRHQRSAPQRLCGEELTPANAGLTVLNRSDGPEHTGPPPQNAVHFGARCSSTAFSSIERDDFHVGQSLLQAELRTAAGSCASAESKSSPALDRNPNRFYPARARLDLQMMRLGRYGCKLQPGLQSSTLVMPGYDCLFSGQLHSAIELLRHVSPAQVNNLVRTGCEYAAPQRPPLTAAGCEVGGIFDCI